MVVRSLSDEEFEKFSAELKTILDDKKKTAKEVAELITKNYRSLTQ